MDYEQARSEGERAAQACNAVAQSQGFDSVGAGQFILELLGKGPMNGEKLVNAAKAQGYIGHDDRCFGAVFGGLARRGLITCIGFEPRTKGHGTSGARIWALST